jgi:hypothetical protein
MSLEHLSEQDRSRLAEIIRGPIIPPATPPKEPQWNWLADSWQTASRYARSRWDAWSVPRAKQHFRAHRREWIAGGAAAMACLILLAIGIQVAARHGTQAIPLQIQERQGQLQIRWDAGSDLIRRAKQATLFITDGPDRLFATLDAARLRRGTVSYARQSERVEFRMALTEPDGQLVDQQAVFFGMPIERTEPQLEASAPPAPPVPAVVPVVVAPPAAEPRAVTGQRSRKKPLAQTGTNLPFTCSAGDIFRKTDAPPGWNTFTCRGNNVWGILQTQQGEQRSTPQPNASTLTAKPASASTT